MLVKHPFAERLAPSAVVVVSARRDTALDIHPVEERHKVEIFYGGDAVQGGEAFKHSETLAIVVTCTLLNHACQILAIMRSDFLNFHFLSF